LSRRNLQHRGLGITGKALQYLTEAVEFGTTDILKQRVIDLAQKRR
jgi:hypothetical protein